MKMNLESLENLRREAYVRAVTRASESDNVIGYIGMNLPVELFYERGLMAVPVYGIDREILQFSREKNLCPLIDATVTYAKTDKCPLIHSSKLIVIENYCGTFTHELEKLTNRKIYIYSGDNNELALKLNEIYRAGIIKASAHEEIQKVSECINNLVRKFNLTDFQGFIIKYFVSFLDLNEQIDFLSELSEKTKHEDFNFTHEFINLIYKCPECRGNFDGGCING